MSRRILSAAIILGGLLAAPAWSHPGSGIVADRGGTVYFLLFGPHNRIMQVDTLGVVTTFVADDRLRRAHHLVLDDRGNLYTTSDAGSVVWRISPKGGLTQIYPRGNEEEVIRIGTGGDPFTIDAAGNIYCTSFPRATTVFRIASDGTVETLAGGELGFADGKGEEAMFGDLHGSSMVLGRDGRLYVSDQRHIRTIEPDGTVKTLKIEAGPAPKYAFGLDMDVDGTVYAADYGGKRVLEISPAGVSTPLAAPARGFFRPTGVAIGPNGEIYAMDDPPEVTRVWRILKATGEIELIASVDHTQFYEPDQK